jgi:hypothetical protein
MLSSFFSKARTRLTDGLWPKDQVVGAVKSRYGSVEHLGDENQFCLYGVTDGDIRFVVVMVAAEGAADMVSEVGFLARFSGFAISNTQIEGMNRNLHISVATSEGDGDVYLIGGVAAAGEFSDSTFGLVLEAWKRDLMIVLHGLSGGASFAAAFPASRLESVRKFALNIAPEPATEGEPGRDLFAAFAGGAHREKAVCGVCGGRGKTGFIARTCGDCDGSGFVAGRR